MQSKKLGLGKLFSIVVHSTSVRQLQLLSGDTFSLVRIRVKFETIFIALLFPWTSFCFPEFLTLNVFLFPGFLIYVPQSRIYVPRCLVYFLESHIHFPELLIELLERFEFLARCPEFMMYFHACSIWTIALTSLFISLRSCCFLCSLFVSCIVHLYPEIHDLFPRTATLLSVFSILIFPNSFLSHIPGLLSRYWISLHISLNFVGSFISLFISIGSFLFVCFCEFWFVSLSLSPLYFPP